MIKTSKFPHLIWILPLFVLWRLAFLFFSHPSLLTVLPHEELYFGALSGGLLEDLPRLQTDYIPPQLEGEIHFTSLLVSLSFRLFGSNLFALKIPFLLFSFLGLFFFYILLKRKLSTSVAILFSLLYIFAPISFIRYTLAPLNQQAGIIILFTALIFFLFTKVLPKKIEKALPETPSNKKILAKISPGLQKTPITLKTALTALLLGIFSSFSLWISPYTSAALLTLIIFWFLNEKTFLATKRFSNFAFGLLIGIWPWILNLSTRNSPPLDIKNEFLQVVSHVPNTFSFLADFRLFSPFSVIMSFVPHHLSSLWIKFFFCTYFLLLFYIFSTYIVRQLKKSTCPNHPQETAPPFSSLFILYTVIMLILLQSSNSQDTSSFILLHPILYILIAYGISKISNHHRPLHKQAPFYVFIAFITLSFLSTGFTFSTTHQGMIRQIDGHSYLGIPKLTTSEKIKTHLQKYENLKPHLDSRELQKLQVSFAYKMVHSHIDFEDLETSVQHLEKLMPEEFKPYFYYYLGSTILRITEDWKIANSRLSFLKNSSDISKRFLAEFGLFEEMAKLDRLTLTSEALKELSFEVPTHLLPAFWRMSAQKLIPQWPETQIGAQTEIFMSLLTSIYRDDFLEGIGIFFYNQWQPSSQKPLFESSVFLNPLPKNYHEHLLHGVGMAFEQETLLNPHQSWKWDDLIRSLDPKQIAYIMRGRQYVQEFFKNPIREPVDSYLRN